MRTGARVRRTSTASSATGPGLRPTSTRSRCVAIVRGARLPEGQLPVHRRPHPGHSAAHQRLQPAGHQRAGRQHLGQLLVALVQGAAVGRHGDVVPTRSPACASVCDARRRPRLYARSLADQACGPRHPSCSTTASDRFDYDPVGGQPHEGRSTPPIEQMLWPEKRDQDPVLGSKIPGVIDRTTQRSSLTIPAGYLPQALQPAGAGPSSTRSLPDYVAADGDLSLGPIPKGVPVGLLANVQLLPESEDPASSDFAKVSDVVLKLKKDLLTMPANASDDELRQELREPRRAAAERQQVPGLRRQPRPLLRDRTVQRPAGPERRREGVRTGAGAERRRQARADRVSEDVLTAGAHERRRRSGMGLRDRRLRCRRGDAGGPSGRSGHAGVPARGRRRPARNAVATAAG